MTPAKAAVRLALSSKSPVTIVTLGSPARALAPSDSGLRNSAFTSTDPASERSCTSLDPVLADALATKMVCLDMVRVTGRIDSLIAKLEGTGKCGWTAQRNRDKKARKRVIGMSTGLDGSSVDQSGRGRLDSRLREGA